MSYSLVLERASGASPLTAPEQEQLREKMEEYCQAQTGMSLEEYRQELLSEEPRMEPEPQM